MSEHSGSATVPIEQLVVLRFMVAEAVLRVRDATVLGRHTSVILLQNVCEFAMVLALDARGAGHSDKDAFETLYSKVVGQLDIDSRWKNRCRWNDVRQLNRVRNEAHHHGITPDHDQLTRHATAAQVFVSTLVLEAFGVDLDTVRRSDSVVHPAVRSQLAAGENALALRDPVAATQAAGRALNLARTAWGWQRRYIRADPLMSARHREDVSGARDLGMRRSLEELGEIEEVQPFAADVGAYLWARSVISSIRSWGDNPEPEIPITLEEAERVLAFVFGWVLRWESFTATYTVDRFVRHLAGRRPPKTDRPELGPRIASVEAIPPSLRLQPGEELKMRIALQLVDLPEDWPDLWLEELRRQVRGKVGPHEIDAIGRLTIFGARPDHDVDTLLRQVQTAISTTNEIHGRHAARRTSWPARHADEAAAYRSALERITLDGEPTVIGVTLEPAGDPKDDRARLVVTFRSDLHSKLDASVLWRRFAGSPRSRVVEETSRVEILRPPHPVTFQKQVRAALADAAASRLREREQRNARAEAVLQLRNRLEAAHREVQPPL